MTFRGLELWDLGIVARVGVRELGEQGEAFLLALRTILK